MALAERMSSLRLVEGMLGKKRDTADFLSLGGNKSVEKVIAKYAGPAAREAVLFSDFIVKINPKGRPQERVMLITDRAIYNLMPSNYGKCKRRIALDELDSITSSDTSSEFVLHIPSEYDYRLTSQRKATVIQSLRAAYQELLRRDLPLLNSPLEDLRSICVNKRMSSKQKLLTLGSRSGALRQDGGAAASPGGASAAAEPPVRRVALTRGWSTEETSVTLDDFDLLKVLGRGSFGKVMLARLKADPGRGVFAMKILRKAAVIARNQVEHTKAEREILEHMRHPFLMRLHYAFQTDSKLYLVMDYLTGGELFFHLKNARRFPEPRARFYAAEIVLGLEHLHAQGVVYRDLKPENVLLDAEGHVCLTDFGLSKRVGPGGTAQTFCGTPEYLAPEIVEGVGHGTEVDWWSLGILLYEMIVGLPPFYSENVQIMYELIRRADLRVPSFVSYEARTLLAGLLARDPSRRLGAGAADAAPIKAHPFFKDIDWDRLYAREVVPPFRPDVAHEADTRNFDAEFTNEPAVDSHVDPAHLRRSVAGAAAGSAGAFENFTYDGSHLAST